MTYSVGQHPKIDDFAGRPTPRIMSNHRLRQEWRNSGLREKSTVGQHSCLSIDVDVVPQIVGQHRKTLIFAFRPTRTIMQTDTYEYWGLSTDGKTPILCAQMQIISPDRAGACRRGWRRAGLGCTASAGGRRPHRWWRAPRACHAASPRPHRRSGEPRLDRG